MEKLQKQFSPDEITELAKKRFQEERKIDHLEGWFLAKEIQRRCDEAYKEFPDSIRIAKTQVQTAGELPLWISDYSIFAGTQDDAFARSYALINPAFSVDSFKGYCDPAAVFGDIEPIGDITQERIDDLKAYNEQTPFAKALNHANELAGDLTSEAVFFFEQVSGHLIPDVRPLLKEGIRKVKAEIGEKQKTQTDCSKREYYQAMDIALDAALV